jgi:hypothetical protein
MRRSRHHVAIAISVSVVEICFVLSGCGDDGSGGQTASALSKAEYVRQADEICGGQEIDKAAQQFFAGFSRKNPPTPEKEAEFVNEVVIPTHQQQLDELRTLPIPAGDEEQVEPFLEEGQAFIDRLGEDPSLFIQQRVTPEFKEAAKQAADYGLQSCAI